MSDIRESIERWSFLNFPAILMCMATMGERIRAARQRRRLTQEQLAGVLGVSRKTVDNWENDRTVSRSLAALEEVLGPLAESSPALAGDDSELVSTNCDEDAETRHYLIGGEDVWQMILTDIEADTEDLEAEEAQELTERALENARTQTRLFLHMERDRLAREKERDRKRENEN